MPKPALTILLLGYARVRPRITPQSEVVLIIVAPYALRGVDFSWTWLERPIWYAITTYYPPSAHCKVQFHHISLHSEVRKYVLNNKLQYVPACHRSDLSGAAMKC